MLKYSQYLYWKRFALILGATASIGVIFSLNNNVWSMHAGTTKVAAPDWNRLFIQESNYWLGFHLYWCTKFEGPIHILRYEDLQRDLRGTLRRAVKFLGFEVNESWLNCAVRRSEELFHRAKSSNPIDPYTEDMLTTLDRYKERVEEVLKDRDTNDKASDGCVSARVFGKGLPVTALASYPGSGNTWARHLLEQSTGYYSGSIYWDPLLTKPFPGEHIQDDTVFAIKTHDNGGNPRHYDRAIVLVRNPRDAMIAEFHRQHTKQDHLELASEAQFRTDWNRFFIQESNYLLGFHLYWRTKFKGPIHILRYEDLQSDLRGTLRTVIKFLGFEVNERWLDCAVRRSEGTFHRTNSFTVIDPYTEDMLKTLDRYKQRVEEVLKDRDSLKDQDSLEDREAFRPFYDNDILVR